MTDTDTIQAGPKDRAASLQASRQVKMDALFKDKKYKILKEVHLKDDERFQTPFGNKGRNGYALQLEDGQEPSEGMPAKFVIGETMLAQIARDYQAVEVPAKERKRRTKEQKAADDAAAAKAKAEAAAAAVDAAVGDDAGPGEV